MNGFSAVAARAGTNGNMPKEKQKSRMCGRNEIKQPARWRCAKSADGNKNAHMLIRNLIPAGFTPVALLFAKEVIVSQKRLLTTVQKNGPPVCIVFKRACDGGKAEAGAQYQDNAQCVPNP